MVFCQTIRLSEEKSLWVMADALSGEREALLTHAIRFTGAWPCVGLKGVHNGLV